MSDDAQRPGEVSRALDDWSESRFLTDEQRGALYELRALAASSAETVAASESTVQTSVAASHTSDAGSTVPTVTTEAFEWTDGGLRSQGVVDTWWEDHPIVAFGELLWTTDLRGGSLRAYRVGGAPLSMLVADVRSLGECSGPGDRPGCVAGGLLSANGVEGQFLQCPFLDDSGVRFVSVQLKSNEIGQCEGNLAYAGHPPFGSEADGDMRIIDLTALIPTAPYR